MAEKWRLFAITGVAATAAYALNLSPAINAVCTLIVGVGSMVACFVGPRLRHAEPRAAFRLIGLASLLFLVGVLLRPAGPPLSDFATVPGYLLLGTFLVLLLRARRSLERHTVLDGLIVSFAGALACALLLAAPAAEITTRPRYESILAGMYPLLDAVLMVMVINLTFTTRSWPPSLSALLGGFGMLFVGDLGYAVIGVTGRTYVSPVFDLPFLLSYTLLGVSVLHPSVVHLGRADRMPVQAWSPARLGLLTPALVTPFVLLAALSEPSRGERSVIAVAGALCVVLLMLRAVFAVRAQAVAQAHAEHQARHDPLTGLPDRRLITEEVAAMLERTPRGGEHRVWVYLVDLDGFKYVNDTWGHDTGDALVIEISRRLRDTLPARTPIATMGGDKFLLAYAGDGDGAMRLAETVRGCFAAPFRAGSTDLPISASIGIAHSDGGPDHTAEALMRDADTAMYRAKDEGPGRITVFDTAMHAQVRERIEIELALRHALANGELHVAYQPIVRLETGVPIGAEALARWTHPERGAIPPGTFIPIAEDAGLIGEIGTHVRREAVRRLGLWRAEGVVSDDFYLSINVSPHQLAEPALPLTVSAELLEHDVPARCVALEVTESAMVDGTSTAARALFELRELGFKILIDDFGTGFSALGYLRKFPATGLKIDRSFVTGLGVGAEDDEIVRAVVTLSHALGLSVIAEGVETRLQRDTLAAVGVRNAQGWLWGPAVPPAEFADHWHVSRSTIA